MPKGLGRRFAPDARDSNFPMRALIKQAPKKELTRYYRYWNAEGWWGNQGSKPQCVAYAWTHWIEDGPVTHRGPAPCVKPSALYTAAQKIDEWPGEDYDGTSVRAGAKVLQAQGWIEAYHWAGSINDIVSCLLAVGPVVVGTDWLEDMDAPDKDGFIHASGPTLGGHAYLLDGVNRNESKIRIKNSWGRNWGERGFAWISFLDMSKLLRAQGEACIATESKR